MGRMTNQMKRHHHSSGKQQPVPPQDNDPALQQVAARYAVRVTDAVRKTIRHAGDPVALQYTPQTLELSVRPEEHADPIGDQTHSPVPGIVHRYPDRVLLTPVHVCAVYCRFCFRREKVGPGKSVLKPTELEKALDYIRSHGQISEVILSGGGPLILSPRKLKDILDALEAIGHVKTLRIHTRIPVADPDRLTDELCAVLRRSKALYVVIHVNHAQELSQEARAGFRKLRQADCVLLSQSVLLRGVNDNAEALEALFRTLVELRVKPYYLHHPDLAPGTAHFRLPLAEGQKIVAELRGRLSGLAQPLYVLDIPGGFGKIPAAASHIGQTPDGYILTDTHGNRHRYAA